MNAQEFFDWLVRNARQVALNEYLARNVESGANV